MSTWKRMDFHNSNVDDLKTALIDEIKKHGVDLKFYIGCDSQSYKGGIRYITAISVVRDRKGGSCFYLSEVEPEVEFTTRLWNETNKSVTLATELEPFLNELGCYIEEVHCDINPDEKYKSHKALNMCRGYVESMGFDCVVKPHSWAASKVADKRTR